MVGHTDPAVLNISVEHIQKRRDSCSRDVKDGYIYHFPA